MKITDTSVLGKFSWWLWRKRLWDFHFKRMSELGKELHEALMHDTWVVSEHTIRHKASGLALWISNGRGGFCIHEVQGENMYISSHKLEKALNPHDKEVLWALYQAHLHTAKNKPVEAALNFLRLKRQQGDQA